MSASRAVASVPENLQLFMDTRDLLKHCPICSGTLFNRPDNGAVRACLVHGNVFSVYQTLGGYHVQVHLHGAV